MEYNEFAERDVARAQADISEETLAAQYVQALGLLSTLKPDMPINVNDPLWMAREIEAHVSALRLRAEKAEDALSRTQEE